MSPKTKKIIGWVLVGLFTFFALGSAAGKLMAAPGTEMAAIAVKMGFFEVRFLIAGLEILAAVALLIPRTSTIGVVLSAGYWGGAAATDITHGQFPGPVLVAMLLLGLVALFRNPELFHRILGKPVQS
jgi:putative oxidoreductase